MEMNLIKENTERFRKLVPEGIELVAVSKFHPAEAVMAAYEAGQRRFGESRVQELLAKEEVLPKDIEWHFIGHLQTNKVRQIIGRTALIESVDSERLLHLIDSESKRAGVVTKVLMQLHVAKEETKFGMTPEEMLTFFKEGGYRTLEATHICGLMGMASNTDDEDRVRQDFADIARCFREVKEVATDLVGFDHLSMGMSGDWQIAVSEGSNMVRIGTAIFGSRY